MSTSIGVEAKTVELFLLIGGAVQDELWTEPSEAGEIIEQWAMEAHEGDYLDSAEVGEIRHEEDCYQQLTVGPWFGERGCQCAQFSETEAQPLAEYFSTEE